MCMFLVGNFFYGEEPLLQVVFFQESSATIFGEMLRLTQNSLDFDLYKKGFDRIWLVLKLRFYWFRDVSSIIINVNGWKLGEITDDIDSRNSVNHGEPSKAGGANDARTLSQICFGQTNQHTKQPKQGFPCLQHPECSRVHRGWKWRMRGRVTLCQINIVMKNHHS